MEGLLKSFSKEYDENIEKKAYIGDELRCAEAPVLFVFLGDKASSTSNFIYEEINRKWDNSEEIVYLNISSKESFSEHNVFNYIPAHTKGTLTDLRKEIASNLYKDKEKLIELNKIILKVKNKIMEGGNAFSVFEKINVNIVTRVDDPLNVILPELAVLIKNRLLEHFKLVVLDLFSLITEKSEEENVGFMEASAMSFFRELEYMQSKEFQFKAPLQFYDTNTLGLDAVHDMGELFDLVYILGDTNEKGIINKAAMEMNSEIIATLCLLKNRKLDENNYIGVQNQYYDKAAFKRDISNSNGRPVYASAGYAKVKRPNSAIAAAALNYFIDGVIGSLKELINKNNEDLMAIFHLDRFSIDGFIEAAFSNSKGLENMQSIMTRKNSLVNKELEEITYREAEQLLYGDSCNEFLEKNYLSFLKKGFNNINFQQEIDGVVNNIIQKPTRGLYCAFEWTSENGVISDLRLLNKELAEEAQAYKEQIEEYYNSNIVVQNFSRFFGGKKRSIEEIKAVIINEIYYRKLYLENLNYKINILKKFDEVIGKAHREVKNSIEELEHIRAYTYGFMEEEIKKQDGYIGKNIKEYYYDTFKKIEQRLKKQFGTEFYFEERFFGDVNILLKQGEKVFVRRAIELCNKYILNQEEFYMSFEEELSLRADAYNKIENSSASREEIYKILTCTLEENSKVNIYMMDYMVHQRYEEKYYFGDYSSEFIQYAFAYNKENRNYKLGCVHERRTSGIEKLSLMGGFPLNSIIYGKHCNKWYENYIASGYELHYIDEKKLPCIEYFN